MVKWQTIAENVKFGNKYNTHIWNIFKFYDGVSSIRSEDGPIIADTLLMVIIVCHLNLHIYLSAIT